MRVVGENVLVITSVWELYVDGGMFLDTRGNTHTTQGWMATKDVSFTVLPMGLMKAPNFTLDHVVMFFVNLINQNDTLPRYAVTLEDSKILFTQLSNAVDEPGTITFKRQSPYGVLPSKVILCERVQSHNIPVVFMCALLVLLDNHLYERYIVINDEDLPGFRSYPKKPLDAMVAKAFLLDHNNAVC